MHDYLGSTAHADVTRWRVRWQTSFLVGILDLNVGEPIDHWAALSDLYVHDSGQTCLSVGEP